MKNKTLSLSIRQVITCLVLCFFSSASYAAQLLMIEEAGCVYCAKFNAEIAPIYPKTDEGKLAPLRRLDLANAWPEDLSQIKPATVTPTFVLIQDDREIGRLYGYQGDEFFWFLLGDLLAKLEPKK
jgi:thioredoxin-related protein